MEQKDLRTKLPELGFSYDRNNEFNRDEYENNNFCGKHLKILSSNCQWIFEMVINLHIAMMTRDVGLFLERKHQIDCCLVQIRFYVARIKLVMN